MDWKTFCSRKHVLISVSLKSSSVFSLKRRTKNQTGKSLPPGGLSKIYEILWISKIDNKGRKYLRVLSAKEWNSWFCSYNLLERENFSNQVKLLIGSFPKCDLYGERSNRIKFNLTQSCFKVWRLFMLGSKIRLWLQNYLYQPLVFGRHFPFKIRSHLRKHSCSRTIRYFSCRTWRFHAYQIITPQGFSPWSKHWAIFMHYIDQ